MKKLIAIFFMSFITACSPQPDNVPEDSFAVDAEGGKAWIKVSDVTPDKFYAIIYNQDGEKLESGTFIFTPPPKEQGYQPKGVNAEYIQKYANYYSGTEISVTDFASGRVFVYTIQK